MKSQIYPLWFIFLFSWILFFSEDNPVYDLEGQMCCVIPFGFGSALSTSRSPCLSTLAYPIKQQAPYRWDSLTTTAQSRATLSIRQTQVPSNTPHVHAHTHWHMQPHMPTGPLPHPPNVPTAKLQHVHIVFAHATITHITHVYTLTHNVYTELHSHLIVWVCLHHAHCFFSSWERHRGRITGMGVLCFQIFWYSEWKLLQGRYTPQHKPTRLDQFSFSV